MVLLSDCYDENKPKYSCDENKPNRFVVVRRYCVECSVSQVTKCVLVSRRKLYWVDERAVCFKAVWSDHSSIHQQLSNI